MERVKAGREGKDNSCFGPKFSTFSSGIKNSTVAVSLKNGDSEGDSMASRRVPGGNRVVGLGNEGDRVDLSASMA